MVLKVAIPATGKPDAAHLLPNVSDYSLLARQAAFPVVRFRLWMNARRRHG
jgi:hypothetical protein